MFRLRRPRSVLHALRRAAAVLLALVALALALQAEPGQGVGEREPAARPLVVAAADLPAGTVLTEAHLALARLPPDAVPSGTSNRPAAVAGETLAAAVRSGEPITDVRLTRSVLTGVLPDGYVATPVRLADLAVASQVLAGDRVDVLATREGAEVAEVLAAGALVLLAPNGADDAAGVLWLASTPEVAARLAAASTRTTLTVSLVPT